MTRPRPWRWRCSPSSAPTAIIWSFRTTGIPSQKQVNAGLRRIHEETGIPLIATNDAHYLRQEDAETQDVLMCIQMGKTVDDPNRMKFETDQFYVKSEDEMAALFPNYPEALENTAKIAKLCDVEFEFGKYHLPHFQLPEGWTDGRRTLKSCVWMALHAAIRTSLRNIGSSCDTRWI